MEKICYPGAMFLIRQLDPHERLYLQTVSQACKEDADRACM